MPGNGNPSSLARWRMDCALPHRSVGALRLSDGYHLQHPMAVSSRRTLPSDGRPGRTRHAHHRVPETHLRCQTPDARTRVRRATDPRMPARPGIDRRSCQVAATAQRRRACRTAGGRSLARSRGTATLSHRHGVKPDRSGARSRRGASAEAISSRAPPVHDRCGEISPAAHRPGDQAPASAPVMAAGHGPIARAGRRLGSRPDPRRRTDVSGALSCTGSTGAVRVGPRTGYARCGNAARRACRHVTSGTANAQRCVQKAGDDCPAQLGRAVRLRDPDPGHRRAA